MGVCGSKKNQNFGRLGSNKATDLSDFKFTDTNDFKIDLLKDNIKPPPNINSRTWPEEVDVYLEEIIKSQPNNNQNGIINDHFTNLANGTIKIEILITGYIRQLLFILENTKLIPYIILTNVKKYYFPNYVAIEIGATDESFYSTFKISHLLSSSSAIHYNGSNDVCYVSTIDNNVYYTDQQPRDFHSIKYFQNLENKSKNNFIDIISHGISNKHLFISTIDTNTSKQHIFCRGKNAFGQCATGDENTLSEWTEINDFWSRNISVLNLNGDKQNIIDIKCGLYHTIFLSANGCVWSCGQNWSGQLGLNEEIRKKCQPQRILFQQKDNAFITPMSSATSVNAGYPATNISFIDPENVITHRGSIELDNLITDRGDSIEEKLFMENGISNFEESIRMKSISCGDSHNLCIDENGELWIFGHIAIDSPMKQHIYEPIKHPWFVKQNGDDKLNDIYIKKIACGSDHSVCCDQNGFCYLFGTNDKGQIGHKFFEIQYEPYIFQKSTDCDNKNKFIFENIKINDVECGQCHTVLLTNTNDLITFGSNHYKQCSSVIKKDIVCFGHILMRHQELGITSDTYIERIIASANSTIIIVNMSKKLKIIR